MQMYYLRAGRKIVYIPDIYTRSGVLDQLYTRSGVLPWSGLNSCWMCTWLYHFVNRVERESLLYVSLWETHTRIDMYLIVDSIAVEGTTLKDYVVALFCQQVRLTYNRRGSLVKKGQRHETDKDTVQCTDGCREHGPMYRCERHGPIYYLLGFSFYSPHLNSEMR